MTTAAALIPDRDQIEIFVEGLFRHTSRQGFVSLRSFYDTNSNQVFRISSVPLSLGLNRLMDEACLAANEAANFNDAPIVFCPPVAAFSNHKHAREVDLIEGLALSVECDQNPSGSITTLENVLGPTTFKIASGGQWTDPATGEPEPKLHGHWRLKVPARDEAALRKLKRAREIATQIVGGFRFMLSP